MEEMSKMCNHILLDIAPEPSVSNDSGIKLVIVLAVIVIVFITVRLIMKAHKKNQDHDKTNTPTENDQTKP